MLRVVEELTNKPKWWLKVKEPEIAAKWKTEILEMDWKTLVGLWAVLKEGMADAVRNYYPGLSWVLARHLLTKEISTRSLPSYAPRLISTKKLD